MQPFHSRRWLNAVHVGVALLAIGLVAGCAESHSGSGELDPSALEIELTPDEYAALCESFARRMGWPDASLYECLDGGAVGRIRTPRGWAAWRHAPAEIHDCRLRVEDWERCAEHYLANGMCDLSDVCRRPPECMAADWQYLRP